MAMIPENMVETIKSAVNIVDVINQYVSLKKQGKNYFGYCPFHDERTPSFSVVEDKQFYKCFSCGRSGNVFSFFMEKDGLSFPESVEKVAGIANIPLNIEKTAPTEAQTQQQKRMSRLLEMHQIATEFYQHMLMNTQEGKQALSYLQQRGFSLETLKQFALGVAPQQRDILTSLLASRGFTTEEQLESGLVIQYQEQLRDRFYARIMFPLRDIKGQTCAFSGRIYLDKEPTNSQYVEAKYLNSPETPLFNKSRFLFNLDLARPAIRKQSEFILFEGYMDVISAWQAGVKLGVASMGTSLTQEQVQQLMKLANKVVLAYDGDNAGIQATLRAVDILRETKHFHLFVLPMLEGMDPDEMIQAKGAHYFLNYLQEEQESVFSYYKRYYQSQFSLESERSRIDYIEALLKELAKDNSMTSRSMHINELAKEFQLSPDVLMQQMQLYVNETRQLKKSNTKGMTQQDIFGGPVSELSAQATQTLVEKAEKQLLYRLFTNEMAYRMTMLQKESVSFSHVDYQTIFLMYQDFRLHHDFSIDTTVFVDKLTDRRLRNLIFSILSSDFDMHVSEQEINDLLMLLKHERLKVQMQQLEQALLDAQRAGNKMRVEEIIRTLITLKKAIKIRNNVVTDTEV